MTLECCKSNGHAESATSIRRQIGRAFRNRALVNGTPTAKAFANCVAADYHGAGLEALVLFSPDLRANMFTWPWRSQMTRLVKGDCRSRGFTNDRHGRCSVSRYPAEELAKLIREVVVLRVRVRVLVVYLPHVDVIDPQRILDMVGRPGPDNTTIVPIEDPEV